MTRPPAESRFSIVSHPPFQIVRCDFTDSRLLREVRSLQQHAYAVEAALIGCWEIPGLRESPEELLASAETFWGCFVPGVDDASPRCAGIVATEPEPGALGPLRISRLAVDPARFRQGVGRRLLSHVLAPETLARASHTAVVVSTGAANAPARALYESMGFSLTRWFATPDRATRLVEYRWERR